MAKQQKPISRKMTVDGRTMTKTGNKFTVTAKGKQVTPTKSDSTIFNTVTKSTSYPKDTLKTKVAPKPKPSSDKLANEVRAKMGKLQTLERERVNKVGTTQEQTKKVQDFKKYGMTRQGMDYIKKVGKTNDSIFKEEKKVLNTLKKKK